MKKIITILSKLVFGFSIAFAQPTASFELPHMGGGIQAGVFTTPLTVEAIGGGDNFGTFQIFIAYDPLVVTPTAVNFTNPMLPFYEWSNNLAYGPDEIILTWLSFASGYAPSPGEVLCTIDWTYTGDHEYTALTFNNVGDEVPGWPEKGMTAVWTSFGTQYILTQNNGAIGAITKPPTTWTGADADRFLIHFTPMGTGENFANSVNIWSNSNNIYVQVPDVAGDIVVFNMMGQEVVRTDIGPGLNIIPMNEVNTYYVVKVLTSDNAVTGKVFIK